MPVDVVEALHRIYVASIPNAVQRNSGRFDKVLEKELEAALDEVAHSELDQLEKWHVVAAALSRRPDLLDEGDGSVLNGFVDVVGSPIKGFLSSGTEEEEEAPETLNARAESRELLITGLRAYADEQERGSNLTQADWARFHELVLVPLEHVVAPQFAGNDGFKADDPVSKPGCNDETDDGDAATIVSRFWSKLPLDAFAQYVNPLYWPELSAFWASMTPVGTSRQALEQSGSYSDVVFAEVVRLPSGSINAELSVTFTRGPDYLLTTYEATTSETDDVIVDSGYVFATTQTLSRDPTEYTTLVYATKTIEFVDDELNRFPDLACDSGWTSLMINMALPAERRATVPTSQESALAGPATAEHEAATAATVGSPQLSELDEFAKAAGELIKRSVAVTKSTVNAVRHDTLGKRHLDQALSVSEYWLAAADAGAKAWGRVVRDLAEGVRRR
jgi:hypothetical protein